MSLRVSVVIATRNRPDRLARALTALRSQTLPGDDFEIVVVDDASEPETAAVLHEHEAAGGPALTIVRREESRGLAAARNAGVDVARGELVAMTDDDCEPVAGWLEAALAAWDGDPKRFVQGVTLPLPAEAHLEGHFAHTLRVESLGPRYETANMFYPRALLEQLGGMDAEHFIGWGGQDVDLAWRAMEAGFTPVWAPDALVYHGVLPSDRKSKFQRAWRWDDVIYLLKRHPGYREHLTLRLFWSQNHWWLVRAAVALALPRRLWWLRWWLAAPYMLRLGTLRPDVVAVLVASDVVEMASCVRGGIRYRVPVL